MAMSRLIELTTPFGAEKLKPRGLSGSETLGRLFEYEIDALSTNDALEHDKILGRHVTLTLELPGGKERYLDACVAQFGLVGTIGDLFRYRIVARSWTWALTRTSDCRIFQEQTVPDIIKTVFADHPDATPEFKLTETYKPRVYCVQYNETDWTFVSRLMEEEGIYSFFRHDKGMHTLVLTDSIAKHPNIGTVLYRPQSIAIATAEEHIHQWQVTREIQPGAMATSDYDFEKPSVCLRVLHKDPFDHMQGGHEIFHYPGEYTEPADGERIARTRLEELHGQHEHITGGGNARTIACGGLITLERLPIAAQNREYLVVEARVTAVNNAWDSTGEPSAEYACDFRLQRSDLPYRSPRITPRPRMGGPQTAVVVGPRGGAGASAADSGGDDIHTDEYGRVKVQFHWDRVGKEDDKSSCWIRVAQIWAGQNWGWMSIPRIGQEVVVSFLEGDPDQPLITGRVYNAKQMPPWTLPANKTQSGILTRSTPGGSPSNANELRFEDKKGSEEVYLHAEKDQNISVENCETHSVGVDRTKTIGHDETTHVKHDRKETVDNDETITIVGNRTETVYKDETISILKNRTENVLIDETITIGGSRTETVSRNETVTVALARTHTIGINDALTIGASHEITVGGMQAISVGGLQNIEIGLNQSTSVGRNQSIEVGKNLELSVGADSTTKVAKSEIHEVGDARSTKVGKDDSLKVEKNLVIDAGDAITIKTGSASITMKKDGTIVIKGKDISIEGSGKIKVKASSDVTIKGSKTGIN